MSILLTTLFSVLAVAIAAPSTDGDLTSTEAKIFDDFNEWSHGDFDKYIKKYLENKAWEICENEDFNIEPSFQESFNRIDEVSKEDLGSMTVCNILKTKIPYVAEPLAKAIDSDCLSKDLSGMAEYVVNNLVLAVGQICAFTAEEVMELFNPCFSKIDFAAEKDCFGNIGYVGNYTRGTPQEVMCRGYAEIRPCFREGIKKQCKLLITRKTAMTFLDGVLKKPCET